MAHKGKKRKGSCLPKYILKACSVAGSVGETGMDVERGIALERAVEWGYSHCII